MKPHNPQIYSSPNLSAAWGRAFLHVFDTREPGCLIISIHGFSGELPIEDSEIRTNIDACLRSTGGKIPSINQTALTIFPYERWLRLNKPDLGTLSSWYLKQFLPRLKARCSKNKHGTYFERMIDYTGLKADKGELKMRNVNQLEHILDVWKRDAKQGKRPRQSALQLSCFDPAKDHTGAALAGFPCLQQLSLTYKESGSLELNAYYPTQYLLDRAYGNYLGLCQLGHSMAHELGLKLTAFNCFIANPELGSLGKTDLTKLAGIVRRRIGEIESEGNKVVTTA